MFNVLTRFAAVAMMVGCFTLGVGPISKAQASDFMTNEVSDAVNLGNWMIRVRGLAILPDTDSNVAGLDVDDRFAPEIDITYFFTNNIAVELVAAYTSHNVELNSAEIGEVDIVPPHLMLQYHFNETNGFKPYVGVGVAFALIVGDEANGGGKFGFDDEFGFSLQVGFDYRLKDNIYLNVDVKKTWLELEGNGGLEVDLDPLLIGVGLGFRF